MKHIVIVRTLLLVQITFSLICNSAEALPSNLRVQLFEMRDQISSVKIKGPMEIVSPRHQRVGNQWVAVEVKGNQFQLRNLSPSNRAASPFLTCRNFVVQASDNRGVRIRVHSQLERAYVGRLVFSIDDSKRGVTGLKISNEVPTSHYVASVVGSESPPHCPPEALKALAVLVTGIVERKKDGEMVGDSTKEQAYKGCEFVRPDVERAVKTILNKRLFFKDSPIQPYYHSTCAGGTSRGEDIFGEGAKPLTYLQSVKCVYCTKSPFWNTKTKTLPAKILKNVFDGGVPTITKFDNQKRPTEVVITSPQQGAAEQHLSGYEAMMKIGRARGWGLIAGTRYRFQYFSSSNIEFVRIQSSGAGHGVGLCQWGAAGLAKQGKTYDQILKFYFPGCKVVAPN
jgi:stage II sporulation protein D